MRLLSASLVVVLWTGCGPAKRGGGGDDTGGPDACEGLECRIDNCAARNMPDTTITGTVYAPNGTLALYGVNVYVPNGDPGPLLDGVQCGQCQNQLAGGSVAQTTSDAAGAFTLTKVPSGVNVPLDHPGRQVAPARRHPGDPAVPGQPGRRRAHLAAEEPVRG